MMADSCLRYGGYRQECLCYLRGLVAPAGRLFYTDSFVIASGS